MVQYKNKLNWHCSKKSCSVNSAGIDRNMCNVTLMAPLEGNFVQINLGKHTSRALLDTGASISCISEHVYRQSLKNIEIMPSSLAHIVGVCGEIHRVLGQVTVPFRLDGIALEHTFQLFEKLHQPVILGMDFLRRHKAKIDLEQSTVSFKSSNSSDFESGKTEEPSICHISLGPEPKTCIGLVRTVSSVVIEPQAECTLPVKIALSSNSCSLVDSAVLLEPSASLNQEGLVGGKCLSSVDQGSGAYRVLNPTSFPVFLKENFVIATSHLIDEQSITQVTDQEDQPFVNLADTLEENQSEINYENIAKDLGLNLDHSELSEEQKRKLYLFLGRNRDIFAKDSSELKEAKFHSHVIHTKTDRPVSKPPYRQTPQMRTETERLTNEMLQNGIIRESNSPWHSPVVLVKKANGEYRFAIDYRELNKVTEPISFPIPTLNEVFDTLADSKAQIFSLCDLRSGFHQIPLCPSTAEKASFITHQGVFTPTRLPFGLMNSPMCFQNLMSKCLKDLNWKIALVYIDDILIFSKNFDQHLEHLGQVFQNLRAANLKIHPGKCKFAAKEVKYLGHIVSKEGIKVDPSKFSAIETYPVPKNVKNVRAFLGLAQFYRRYIKSFAQIALPLNKLLRKDVKFEWNSDCDQAFKTLKKALITAPVLAFAQFDKPFILAVDSSDESIGYVLSPLDSKGREHPVAYGGRALRNEELRWHITDKEGLALVEAVRQFRPYLANMPFTVYTDNVSVKWLQQIKNCQGRLGRWALLLQGYNMEIIQKSSRNNANADGLSRRSYPPLIEEVQEAPEICTVGYEVTFCYANDPKDVKVLSVDAEPAEKSSDKESNFPNLQHLQQNCPDFKAIYTYKTTGDVPDDAKQARNIVAEASQFEIQNGLLFHFYTPRSRGLPREERLVKQLAVPKIMRDDILRSYHDSLADGGHQGQERTFAAIRLKYYWPKMYEQVGKYVQSCELCQQVKRPVHAKPPPLQPLPVSDLFSRWHIDILSGLPTTKDKYKHILVVVDSYSKWMEAHPLRTQEATEVAAVLYREVISRYGAPRTLVSDRGQTFMSKLIAAMCELFQITKHFTSSYHPQCNSTVERANATILQAFRIYCKDKQDDWPEILPSVMMAHRMTPCTQSSQESPFFLLFGREMHVPIDTALLPRDTLAQDHKIHLNNVLKQLETTRKIATENIKAAQARYKHQFDKRSKEPKFQPADRVWLYCTKVAPGKAPKLHRKWAGPYYITLLGPHHTYRIRNCATNKEVKSLINGVRLKPYYDPEDRPTNPPEGLENMEEELDAEEITDLTLEANKNEVRVEQNQVREETNSDKNKRNENQVRERANKGRTIVEQSRAQKEQNSCKTKEVENQAQRRPNIKDIIVQKNDRHSRPSQLNNRENANARSNQIQQRRNVLQSDKQNTKIAKKTVNKETQKKSQALGKGKGKKLQGKCKELQDRQSLQSQTGPREIRQSSSQPTKASEPLPGGSHETDESVSKREKLEGQVREESAKHKMFSVESIDKLLTSRRNNGILYYRVKWKQPGSRSTWEYASSIPQVLIREFHASRTMSGKMRKRPLKGKHKFFDKVENPNSSVDTKVENQNRVQNSKSHRLVPGQSKNENGNETKQAGQVSSASAAQIAQYNEQGSENNKTSMVGIKLIKGRSYYLIQHGNKEPEFQTVNMAHWYARDFITHLIETQKKRSQELDILAIRNKHNPKEPPFDPLKGVMTDSIHEVRRAADGSWQFLEPFRSLELPPEWSSFDAVPPGSINRLINNLKDDYYRALGQQIIY